ncbi:uncharacterized protein NPIL_336711 [Nephila pilipes]|uniref:Uncharacterized protein n=1 Tax=Nephila pilipes TaxID=299642 RepID=A0A8X6PIH0_NEPPI|nr:uncharacterized protein NPIL_336711 [Nephila pilipes]
MLLACCIFCSGSVILCAFIVYALGFKSPVQPPSFEGIQEEKKLTKKRRGKETQKSNKLVQNGKVNGNTVAKTNIVPTKKKEPAEKSSEKSSSNAEKAAPAAERKANKKARTQNEKKSSQDKKTESFSHDDFDEDGWMEFVSKKGRKNRKKDDITSENQSSPTLLSKASEANKSDDSSPVEESPKKSTPKESPKKNAAKESPKKNLAKDSSKNVSKESPKKNATKDLSKEEISIVDSSNDHKQFVSAPGEEKVIKDVKQFPNVEKSKMQNVEVEVSKNDNVEKQLSKETAANGIKVIEESSKSKKKKKKNADVFQEESEPLGKISNNISDSAAEIISETLAPKKTATTNSVADLSVVNSNKVEVNQPSEVKTSNVAFDELAGLYPESKEQKKKKKVRRDH